MASDVAQCCFGQLSCVFIAIKTISQFLTTALHSFFWGARVPGPNLASRTMH